MPEPSASSNYPQARRLAELFRVSLQNPVSPYVVGEKIRDIVDSDSWQLRYPVGPDSQQLLAWRASMTDEQWVASAAVSDEEWIKGVRETFGLNVTL